MNREENLARFGREAFDLIVIGGGITGAGIALDAASRGLKVALLERRDFASGTSSKSSKLIHGGLRYLRNFQFKVTFEASQEKKLLKKLAPHLVEETPFLLPVSSGRAGRAAVATGLWIYDFAAGFPKGMVHKRVNPADAVRYLPGLRADELTGAYLYYDAKADDCRLVMHVLKRASEIGAVIANYAPVDGFIRSKGRVAGVTCLGREIRGRVVVNATGVWCDEVRRREDESAPPLVRPSKGVHLVLSRKRLPLEVAAVLPSPDQRVVFVIPNGERVIVGTTDTDYEGDIDHPRAERKDVEYLLNLLNDRLPGLKATRADIISTYAGLRPLIQNGAATSSKVPREHKIEESDSGLITITGGKLTTYRLMARELVDRVMKKLRRRTKSRTHAIDLYASEGTESLEKLYGSEAKKIADRTPMVEDLPYVWGEVDYAVEHEMAVTVGDVLARRTRMTLFDRSQGAEVAEKVAQRMGRRLGWSSNETRRQIDSFQAELADYR